VRSSFSCNIWGDKAYPRLFMCYDWQAGVALS
jgi:hypothetical protein